MQLLALRSVETNELVENIEPQSTNTTVRENMDSRSHISKNTTKQNEQSSDVSSPSIKNHSPESFYNQQLLMSNDLQSSSDRSHSPESIHDQFDVAPSLLNRSYSTKSTNEQRLSNSTNVASSSLIRRNSFEEAYDQQPLVSTAITSSSLIRPFKNDLDVCLYLVQHPQLIDLALDMIKAGGQGSIVTRGKANKFNVLPDK
ncbi:7732_t:CDS:2, partial [Racocetra fulgida]